MTVLAAMDQNSASTDEYSAYYKVGHQHDRQPLRNRHDASANVSPRPPVRTHSFDAGCLSSPGLIARLDAQRNRMNEDEKLADESLAGTFEREFASGAGRAQQPDEPASVERVGPRFDEDDTEEQPARKSPSPESRPEHPASAKCFVWNSAARMLSQRKGND